MNHCQIVNASESLNSSRGPPVNDVGNGEGSKIGQNCQRIVQLPTWEGGVKNPKKLSPLFMDGPKFV